MALWICFNCGVEPFGKPFEGTLGTCPECGTTERVLERSIIHYDPPHPKLKHRGTGVRPCDGKPVTGVERTIVPSADRSDRVMTAMATGEPSAVTCPKCRASEVWKANYTGEPVVVEPDAA